MWPIIPIETSSKTTQHNKLYSVDPKGQLPTTLLTPKKVHPCYYLFVLLYFIEYVLIVLVKS